MATFGKIFGSGNTTSVLGTSNSNLNTIFTLSVPHGASGGIMALEEEMGLFLEFVIGWSQDDIKFALNL